MPKEPISREEAESIAQTAVTDEGVECIGIDSILLKQIGSLVFYEIEGGIVYADGNTSSFIVQLNAYSGELVGREYY